MMVLRLAARNLRRNLRRTFLSTLGVGLGLALSLISLGLGDGGHFQMIENGVRIGQGHLTVQAPDYLETPSPGRMISDPSAVVAALSGVKGIREIHPRVRGEGILSTAQGSEGIVFQGVDPGAPAEARMIRDSLAEGSFLSAPEAAEILIGEKMAMRLKTRVGRKVVLTFQDAGGEITSVLLRVAGIFRSGSSAIDGSLCLAPIGTLQKALGMGQGVTSLAVYLEDPFRQEKVREAAAAVMPPGAVILSWQSLQPDLRDYVVLDDVFGYLIYGIILFIVCVGVLNTILMSVMERRREVGILTALGMPGGAVMRMILAETAFVTLLGIGIGTALGLGAHVYFSIHGLDLTSFSSEEWNLAGTVVDPVLRSKLRPVRVGNLCLSVLLISLTLGVYPAWKASRIQPVEAMEKP